MGRPDRSGCSKPGSCRRCSSAGKHKTSCLNLHTASKTVLIDGVDNVQYNYKSTLGSVTVTIINHSEFRQTDSFFC